MIAQTWIKARRAATGLALAGAGLALVALPTPVRSQTAYDEPSAGDVAGVTVYAPGRYVRQPTTGARVRLDTVSMAVPLDDLDLSTRYGAREAKYRISQAAREVCDRAEAVYPKDGDVEGGCYSTAVRQALARAERLAGYPIVAWGYR